LGGEGGKRPGTVAERQTGQSAQAASSWEWPPAGSPQWPLAVAALAPENAPESEPARNTNCSVAARMAASKPMWDLRIRECIATGF